MVLMLPPAEKALPSPVMINTETAGFSLAHVIAVTMSVPRSVLDSALRTSSLLKVRTAMPSSSVSAASVSCGSVAIKASCLKRPAMVSVGTRRYNGRHPERAMLYCTPLARVSRASRTAGIPMAKIEVRSEITGTVWQLKAKPGDKVEEGDTLIVVESMKMEIPVITEDGGTVKEILVKEKEPVAEGQVVAVLED